MNIHRTKARVIIVVSETEIVPGFREPLGLSGRWVGREIVRLLYHSRVNVTELNAQGTVGVRGGVLHQVLVTKGRRE